MLSKRNYKRSSNTGATHGVAPTVFLAVVLTLVLGCSRQSQALADVASVPGWRELSSPEYLSGNSGAIYYSFQTRDGTRIHLVVVDTKSGKWKFLPVLNEQTATTSDCAEKHKASAAVNGGYFNLSDGASTSYVVMDGKQVADPHKNQALVENAKLAPYLNVIFNRSEIRFLEDGEGKVSIDIAPHEYALPAGKKLVHALQGGPRLLPILTSKHEAFLRTNPDGTEADSIGSLKPAARTAFGITPDGYAMLLCAASPKQDPESHGLTLIQLTELMRSLGCSEAINLDGGTSTTMFVRTIAQADSSQSSLPTGRVVCGKKPETLVKSVLLLAPATK